MTPRRPAAPSTRETYVTARTLARQTAGWLRTIAPYNFRRRRLRAARAALLVVDMQRFFLEPGYPLASPNGRVILPRIRALVRAFRRARRPVLYLVQMNKGVAIDRGEQLSHWWPTPPLEGSPGVAVHPALRPRPSEKVIPKRRYSGFHGTDLDLTLRVMGVADVVVCGVFTNVCPAHTAQDAFLHDYRVFYPADGTAALNEELHVAALRSLAGWYAKVVSVEEICTALRP